jgi:hypothetical protein
MVWEPVAARLHSDGWATRIAGARGTTPDEVPDAWVKVAGARCAYLAFGDTYAAETARARQAGWPVTVLDGGHLHMLVDPDEVAAAIVGLLAYLG